MNENNQSDIGNERNSYSDLQCQGQNFDERSKVLKMNEDSDCEKDSEDRDRKQPSDGFPSNPSLPSSIVCSSSKKQDGIESNNQSTSSHFTQYKDQASHIKSKNGALFLLRVFLSVNVIFSHANQLLEMVKLIVDKTLKGRLVKFRPRQLVLRLFQEFSLHQRSKSD